VNILIGQSGVLLGQTVASPKSMPAKTAPAHDQSTAQPTQCY
jgi:hypothetical protein